MVSLTATTGVTKERLEQLMNQTSVQTQPKKVMTIRDRLNSDEFRNAVAQVLPRHLTPERFVRIAILATSKTPGLLKCDQGSLFQALTNLSMYGLEPDGRRAHLIPFKRKDGGYDCQLIIDYKGLAELVMRSGLVTKIHADKVCDNDEFEFDCGEVKRHRIDLKKPRGRPYAYYAMVIYQGQQKADCMSLEDVENIRKRSKAANNGPWTSDYDEMAKKTVFRRLTKWLPLTPAVREAVEVDDEVAGGRIIESGISSFEIPESTEEPQQQPEPKEDAKEESAAGLAPAGKDLVYKPKLDKVEPMSPEPAAPRQLQEDLKHTLEGVPFDDFKDWAKVELPKAFETHNVGACKDWLELAEGFCDACMENPRALARCIKKYAKREGQ